MKHLLIGHEEPINRNFCLKLLTITLTANKNQGCQEKKIQQGCNKKSNLFRKKVKHRYNKNQDCLDKKLNKCT